jgi:hypothetical protein
MSWEIWNHTRNAIDSCQCNFHRFFRGQIWCSGGWLDPRRNYNETAEEFLRRIPDGFVQVPDDCMLRGPVFEEGAHAPE